MLDKSESDTEVVRTWLANALGAKDAKGRRAALAKRCGVSSQAVSGWLKTGRITKKNLELATAFFGHGPTFTTTGTVARDAAARYCLSPPPAPPRDFSDRHTVNESDWALLQDIKTAATEAELAEIRKRAATIQRMVAQQLATLRTTPDDK